MTAPAAAAKVGRHQATREGKPMAAKKDSGTRSPGRHRALERDPLPGDRSAPKKPPSKRQAATEGAKQGATAGPEGAALGAAMGGSSAGKARREYRKAVGGTDRRILVGELLICMLLVALSPLTDAHKNDGPAKFMKRLSAVAGLFLVLGLVSTAGKTGAKVATGFGGLVTLALVVSQRDVFVVLANRFGTDEEGVAGPPASEPDNTGVSDPTALTFQIGDANAGGVTASSNPARPTSPPTVSPTNPVLMT